MTRMGFNIMAVVRVVPWWSHQALVEAVGSFHHVAGAEGCNTSSGRHFEGMLGATGLYRHDTGGL